MYAKDKHTHNLYWRAIKFASNAGPRAAIQKAKWLPAAAACLLLSSCGPKTYELEHAYDVYGTSIHYEQPQETGAAASENLDGIHYFAQELCTGKDNQDKSGPDAQAAEAAGAFHLSDGTIPFSKNIYKKLYPASTTKMLTAYVALKHGHLEDTVTVSQAASYLNQPEGSSVAFLREGDKLTLEDLLYGLLLTSGNDAAVAIAEHISGDMKSFAKLMNKEARSIGATRSHFVNSHGLQNKNHYTCAYDLYLILNAALGYPEFETILGAKSYTATYTDINGIQGTQEWKSSNRFFDGTAQPPDGVTVIGGKTGTTNDAGYCLALYGKNQKQEPVIAVVMKATDSDSLYNLIGELLIF